jgi:hypothetical protein
LTPVKFAIAERRILMPRVNLGKPKRQKLSELLWGVLSSTAHGNEAATVANILQCSMPTARKRLREPKKMPLEELLRLTKCLEISIDELREAITY